MVTPEQRQKILSNCLAYMQDLGKRTGRVMSKDMIVNLQYLNETQQSDYIDFWDSVVTYLKLSGSKTFLDFGSGTNTMAAIGRWNGLDFKTSDLPDERDTDNFLSPFPLWRKRLDFPLDITNSWIDQDDFTIGTDLKFDTMVITRFSLFKERKRNGRKLTEKQIKRFFDEVFRVADKIVYVEFPPNEMRKDLVNYAKMFYNVQQLHNMPQVYDVPLNTPLSVTEISKR